jgi:ribosomal-protein-alanine N-acetyltransferase
LNLTIDLAPIARADLPKLLEWRNDYRVWRWTRQADYLNEVKHAEWFERQAKDPTIRMYKIVLRAQGTTNDVGVCGLTSIDHFNRRAEFSLYVAPAYHRRGIGRSALAVLLGHGFDNLGLNLIWGETFDGNPAARVFEAVGMRREGTRRDFYWREGRFIGAHLYSITSEEWRGRSSNVGDNAAIPVAGGQPGSGDALPTPLKARRARKLSPPGSSEPSTGTDGGGELDGGAAKAN